MFDRRSVTGFVDSSFGGVSDSRVLRRCQHVVCSRWALSSLLGYCCFQPVSCENCVSTVTESNFGVIRAWYVKCVIQLFGSTFNVALILGGSRIG